MTCIVGLKTKSGVHLAGDSLTTVGSTATNYYNKLFCVNDVILGCAGSVNQIQFSGKFFKENPYKSGNFYNWLFNDFCIPLREEMAQKGLIRVRDNELQGDINILIGHNKSLYTVYSDFAAVEISGEYTSIGSGSKFALGSLASSEGSSPKERVTKSIKTAIQFDIYCGGRVNYMTNE